MMRPYAPEAASVVTHRRALGIFTLLLLFASACTHRDASPPATRDVAWWWWMAPAAPQPGPRVALTYVQAGTLEALAGSAWPVQVPPAERYVLVWRSERRAVPPADAVRPLAAAYTRARTAATAAGAHIVGMQIDADVPTASLRTFATWLDEVRLSLPHGDTLSVTGLLDWFRDGTDIARVAEAVDELVPQFYDVEPRSVTPGIAYPFDLAGWTTRLDALERPYRLGLATFGRIERTDTDARHTTRVALRDVTPLDLAQRLVRLPGEHASPAGERVVDYSAPGESPQRRYQLILPPRDVIARGERMAAVCGRWCAGVAFFRWPSIDESLTVGPGVDGADAPAATPPTPDASTAALGPARDVLVVEPAACVPLWCADAWLIEHDRFPMADQIVRLRVSRPIAMVHARDPRGPVRVSSSTIDLRLPAYHGLWRVPLARIFTDEPARITLDPAFHESSSPPPLARR